MAKVTKLITAVLFLFVIVQSAHAQSLVENIRSGALQTSIVSILGDLTSVKKLIESVLIAIIAGIAAKGGAKKVWPDMKNAGGIGAATGLLVGIGYASSNISENPLIGYILGTLFFGLLAHKLFFKDKPIPALITGLLIALLLFGGVSALQAKTTGISFLGIGQNSAIPASRIIAGTQGSSSDPNTNWQLAEDARKRFDYTAARNYYRAVTMAGAGPHNPHYFDAADYINIGGQDKLFREMVSYYSKVVDIEASSLAYINADLRDGKKYPEGSDSRKAVEKERTDLVALLGEQKEELCTQLALRGRQCK